VAGLSGASAPWRTVGLDPGAVIAAGGAAIRHERGHALDELLLVVEAALVRGGSGVQNAEQLLSDLLLLRSPRLARRVQRRVYGPLGAELARTLDISDRARLRTQRDRVGDSRAPQHAARPIGADRGADGRGSRDR
jgi:hypothetical protein